jgi:uncharacterized surface anchored protein
VVVNPNDTQTLHFTNTPSTTLVIEKYIEGTTTPLKGVTFLVTDSSGAVVGRSNGEFITDEHGRVVIHDLEPGTTVTAREVKTVDGFVLDGAVIIGTAAEAECDKLCVVTAPFEVSVERIAARDGISPEMAARRLNAQTPEAVLTARADYILPNTSTREALAKAANELCDALIGEGCCA